MGAATISDQAIFVERDGWVFYVTNWQKRFTAGGRAKLVRLSPRHFVRYHELKAKGRSPKTIALLLFKRVPVKVSVGGQPLSARTAKSDTRTVTVDIAMLTHEQLLSLVQRALGERLPTLRTMPLLELRRLYLAVEELRHRA
jgi:hypothetical protein